jgi:heme-degrading monooxygenase HmoA
MVQVIWEFVVRKETLAQFEQAYGPQGSWVRLFERYPGYQGTELVRDAANPLRYMTIDSWDTLEHRGEMLKNGQAEYTSLDRELGVLVDSEIEVGVFTSL